MVSNSPYISFPTMIRTFPWRSSHGVIAIVFTILCVLAALVWFASMRTFHEADLQLRLHDIASQTVSHGRSETKLQELKGVLTGNSMLTSLSSESVLLHPERLTEILHKQSGEAAIFLDASGYILSETAAVSKLPRNISYKFRYWFQQAIAGNIVTEPLVGVTGRRSVVISAPWYGESAAPQGVMVVAFDVEKVDQFLRDKLGQSHLFSKEDESPIGCLVSPDGIILSTNKPEWMLKPLWALSPKKQHELTDKSQFGTKAFLPDLSASVGVKEDATLTVGRSRYRMASIPMQLEDANGRWSLVLLAPEDSGFPAIVTGIGIAGFLVVAVLGTVLVISRYHRKRSEREKLETLQELLALRDDVDRITRHDMKTPVIGFQAGCRLLKSMGELNAEQLEVANMLEDQADSMMRQLTLSLDLFKIEQGTYEYEVHSVDVVATIASIVMSLDIAAFLANRHFSLIIDGATYPKETLCRDADLSGAVCMHSAPPAVVVGAEKSLLYSAMANLIKNALEASERGQMVNVSIDRADEVTISIWNAQPVPEDMRENFFGKYATSGKVYGTGLGTYSARMLVEAMGGGVSMETSEMSGTTVRVVLPKWVG